MIDNFALGICHGLMLLIAWRLITRADLDNENARRDGAPPKHWKN